MQAVHSSSTLFYCAIQGEFFRSMQASAFKFLGWETIVVSICSPKAWREAPVQSILPAHCPVLYKAPCALLQRTQVAGRWPAFVIVSPRASCLMGVWCFTGALGWSNKSTFNSRDAYPLFPVLKERQPQWDTAARMLTRHSKHRTS